MKKRLGAFAALASVLAVFVGFTVAPAASAQTTTGLSVNCTTSACLTQTITGTATNAFGVTNTYNLTATLQRFVNVGGALQAVYQIAGTINGVPITSFTTTAPVTLLGSNGTCTILDLTLGPLHLDLLGLVVDLNQVHLTITGQTGPGNLLGNLLCGLANALNGNQAGGLATLLNRLLAGL